MGQPNPTQTVTNPRIAKLIELEVSGRIKPEHQQELDTYRAQGLAPKKSSGNSLTEYQGKSTGFYERALGADRDFTSAGEGGEPAGIGGDVARAVLPENVVNTFTSPARQKAEQAKRDFILASLRYESGAAIAASELEKQEKTFFPQTGDSHETIAQKAKARQRIIESLKVASGPGADNKILSSAREVSPVPDDKKTMLDPSANLGETLTRAIDGPKEPTQDYIAAQKTPDGQWMVTYADGRKVVQKDLPPLQVTVIDDSPREELIKQRDTAAGGLDAAVRGAADVLTLGTADELSAAGKTIFGGGTMEDNLRRERAIDKTDEQVNPWLRFGGQLAGGALLPMGEAKTATELGKVGAMYGGAYGVGSGEGVKDRFVKGLGGAGAGLALGYLGGKLVNKIGDGNPPPGGTPSDLMRDAKDIGIKSVLPADVGGPVTRGLTATARQGIVSEYPIAKTVAKAVTEGAAARDQAASLAGNVLDPIDAGELARKAANVYSRETGKTGDALYTRAYDRIGDIKVDLPIARQALKENIDDLKQAIGGENDPLVKQFETLQSQIANGQFSVKGIRMTRTRLRDQMMERGLRGSDTDRRLQTVLDAANQDIENALVAAGKPDAAAALHTANEFWKNRVETIDEVLEPLLGKNAPRSGEQIFTALERMGKQNTGDAKRLSRLMSALNPAEANSLRASVIHQLGTAKAGQQGAEGGAFSFAEFLTRWNDMSPAAKDVMFQGPARVQLDKLARVSEGIKATSKYANTSNTARSAVGQALLSGTIGGALDVATLGKVTAAQYITGLMLASPKVAKVLASALSFKTKAAYAAAITRAAGENPALANDAAQFARALAANDNYPITAAASGDKDNKGNK